VDTCASCQAEVQALDDTWALLGEIPDERVDRIAMRTRFDQMMASHAAWTVVPPSTSVWDRAGQWMSAWTRAGLAAAAAVVLLAAGVGVGRFMAAPVQQAAPAMEIADLRRDLHEMREMLTLSLMQQPAATERLRGIGWSSQIDQPDNQVVTALVDALLHDQNVNVRLAAIDALRRVSAQPVVRTGTERALTEAPSPLVQTALIDFMVDTGDKQAVGALRRLSEDATVDEAVRARATWGVARLES
jgi:hypothetical protein